MPFDEFEARVRAGRVPPDAEVQFAPLTGQRFVPAAELEVYRALRNDAALAYQRGFGSGDPPVLTALLLGVQIRLWWMARIADLYWGLPAALAVWSEAVFEDRQIWRLFTMGLLHVDTAHIALNSLFFAGTGLYLERAVGRANLALIFFASVFGGSVLSASFSPFAWSIGASGGVYGMITACIAFVLLRTDLVPPRRRWFALFLLPYVVLMFLSGLSSEGVDNWAHFGGLLTGALLGALLDPEGLERKVGWNRRVRRSMVAGMVLCALAMGGLGPRIEPLVDERHARRTLDARRKPDGPPSVAVPEPEDTRTVVYEVPAGWRPGGNVLGARGFTSTMATGQRVFVATERVEDRLVPVEAAVEAWVARVKDRLPAAIVEPARPVTVAGLPGLEVRVQLPGGVETDEAPAAPLDEDDPRRRMAERDAEPGVLVLRVATRGVSVLEATWQVEADRERWLRPLAERLWAQVEWRPPRELVAAEQALALRPANGEARLTLARELARAGRTDEARQACAALLDEASADPERWVVCLEVDRIAVLRGPPLEGQIARALRDSPLPKTIAAAAFTLEQAGDTATARGLLDVAWAQAPGDIVLKRARRGLGLSNVLDRATGEPWAWVNDPVSGAARPAADRARLAGWTVTLEAARAAAAWADAERARTIAAAVRAIEMGETRAIGPFYVLKDGAIPAPGDEDARRALLDDLRAATRGQVPEWAAPFSEALAAYPDAVERLGR